MSSTACSEVFATVEILAHIFSFVDADVVVEQEHPEKRSPSSIATAAYAGEISSSVGGEDETKPAWPQSSSTLILHPLWQSIRLVDRPWKREADRLIGLGLAKQLRPWHAVQGWPVRYSTCHAVSRTNIVRSQFTSNSIPDDADAARRAVTELQALDPSLDVDEESVQRPRSFLIEPDQLRKLFEDFPSLTSLKLKLPHVFGDVIVNASRFSMAFGPLSLEYDRASHELSLFIDLTFAWRGSDDNDFDHFQNAILNPIPTATDPEIEWKTSSLSYRSVLKLVGSGPRRVRSLKIISPVPCHPGITLLETTGYDPKSLSTTLEDFAGASATFLALDYDKPSWARLEDLSLVGSLAQEDEEHLKAYASAIARAPRIRSVQIHNATCSQEQWHPFLLLLRSTANHLSVPSSLQSIWFGTDHTWRSTVAMPPSLREQASSELYNRFPQLTSVRYTLANPPAASDSRYYFRDTAQALEIKALLSIASGHDDWSMTKGILHEGWTVARASQSGKELV